MYYSPFRRSPRIATFRARLACLIHAANVHSEPGSNPSIDLFLAGRLSTRVDAGAKRSGLELQQTGSTCLCHLVKVARAIFKIKASNRLRLKMS